MLPVPMYLHDCAGCCFLGVYIFNGEVYDLYVCLNHRSSGGKIFWLARGPVLEAGINPMDDSGLSRDKNGLWWAAERWISNATTTLRLTPVYEAYSRWHVHHRNGDM
mgnify:FL=1